MPLQPGNSRAVVSHNISEMVHAGHPQNQAIAAALSNARRYPHAADGGMIEPEKLGIGGIGAPRMPFFERSEAYGMSHQGSYHPGGFIASATPGRTDRLPMSVAADSFVVPADVTSILGQGNSLAGSHVMDAMLRTGPYGTSLPQLHTRPHFSGGMHMRHAKGGHADISSVITAGGEYVIPPEKVKEFGEGSLSKGHARLREFVKRVRTREIRRLKTAPPPKK